MNVIAAVFMGAVFFVSVATAQQPPSPTTGSAPAIEPSTDVTPHHPDEISRLREEWTPPGEEPRVRGSGDTRGFVGQYLSTKPLAELWVYYATKLGMTAPAGSELKYQPNLSTEQFPRLGPLKTDGHATLTIRNIRFPDQTEAAATLTRREPSGQTVTVFLASQGEHTFVCVLIAPLH